MDHEPRSFVAFSNCALQEDNGNQRECTARFPPAMETCRRSCLWPAICYRNREGRQWTQRRRSSCVPGIVNARWRRRGKSSHVGSRRRGQARSRQEKIGRIRTIRRFFL